MQFIAEDLVCDVVVSSCMFFLSRGGIALSRNRNGARDPASCAHRRKVVRCDCTDRWQLIGCKVPWSYALLRSMDS